MTSLVQEGAFKWLNIDISEYVDIKDTMIGGH